MKGFAGRSNEHYQESSSARFPPAILTEVPMRLIGLAVVLALSLILAPLAAKAQQPGKVYRVGLLAPGAAPFFMDPL